MLLGLSVYKAVLCSSVPGLFYSEGCWDQGTKGARVRKPAEQWGATSWTLLLMEVGECWLGRQALESGGLAHVLTV